MWLTSLTEVGELVGAPEAVPLGVPPERHAVAPAHRSKHSSSPGRVGPVLVSLSWQSEMNRARALGLNWGKSTDKKFLLVWLYKNWGFRRRIDTI